MNQEKALKILGLNAKASQAQLKKKYRELMLLTHPDRSEEHGYAYDAREINAAYEYILKYGLKTQPAKVREAPDAPDKKSSDPAKWNAPVNDYAYKEREILHKVEDEDGEVIGTAVLDKGKFYWTKDEEFDLFLRSLYECAISIVKDGRTGILPEVTYLLAQQFVDRNEILEETADGREKFQGEKVYCYHAMLEVERRRWVLKPGTYVYPAGTKEHRLWVRDDKKQLGYLSFKDDRLYYGIIPLFEQRAAKVQMQITGPVAKGNGGRRYYPVELKILLTEQDSRKLAIDINHKIDKLIRGGV